MSEVYEIAAVGDPRDWRNDYGSYLAYPLDLKDQGGQVHLGVEWSRKVDPQTGQARQPQAGERVVAQIQNGPHGQKLKVDYDATKELNGGGGSTHTGGSRNWGWQPDSERDPERVARIGRSHAQEMALRYFAAGGHESLGSLETDQDTLARIVRPVIDWFEMDVEEAAAQKAARAGGASTGNGSKDASPPVDTPAPEQAIREATPADRQAAAASQDDDIPFARPEYPDPFSERERKSNRP